MAEPQPPVNPEIPSQETPPQGEKAAEQRAEQAPVQPESQPQKPAPDVASQISAAEPQAAPLPPQKVAKSETLEAIEDIMEEDLADVYKKLPDQAKKAFREKGEETATEIEGMMYKVKVKSKKVFKLLFGWLKIIPGVNKYFLQQEAKLKTDEIMHLKEDMDKTRKNQV
jgi:hypothetical protein